MLNLDLLKKWNPNLWDYMDDSIEQIAGAGYRVICPYINEILKVQSLNFQDTQHHKNCIAAMEIVYGKMVELLNIWDFLLFQYDKEYFLPLLENLIKLIQEPGLRCKTFRFYVIEFFYNSGRLIDAIFQNWYYDTPEHFKDLMRMKYELLIFPYSFFLFIQPFQ